MKATVYLETSFFSFYYDERKSPEVIAMRKWTRLWWELCRDKHNLFTSTAVLVELDKGELPHRKSAFDMAQQVSVLKIGDEVEDIVDVLYKTQGYAC